MNLTKVVSVGLTSNLVFVKCIDRFSEEDKRKLGAMGAIIDTEHEVYIDLEKLLTIAIDNDDLK